jgi:hypothetical protein
LKHNIPKDAHEIIGCIISLSEELTHLKEDFKEYRASIEILNKSMFELQAYVQHLRNNLSLFGDSILKATKVFGWIVGTSLTLATLLITLWEVSK